MTPGSPADPLMDDGRVSGRLPDIVGSSHELLHVRPGPPSGDAPFAEYDGAGIGDHVLSRVELLDRGPCGERVRPAHDEQLFRPPHSRIRVHLALEAVGIAPESAREERARPGVNAGEDRGARKE